MDDTSPIAADPFAMAEADSAVAVPDVTPPEEPAPIEEPAPSRDVAPEQEPSAEPEVSEDNADSAVSAGSEAGETGDVAAADPTAALERIDRCLEQLSSAVTSLDERFARRMSYDSTKEQIIDRQHSELVELREGLKRDLLRPVLYDVAEVLDDIRKSRQFYAQQEDGQTALSALEGVEEQLVYLLEKNDVERMISEEGDPFVAGRQRMIKTAPTADSARVRTVAESVAPGYLYGREALFKEKVIVYKFTPAAQPVEPPQPADASPSADTPQPVDPPQPPAEDATPPAGGQQSSSSPESQSAEAAR